MTQTFRGKTLAEARAQARAALGTDVEVMTTRTVSRGGLSGWLGARDFEITASAPLPATSSSNELPARFQTPPPPKSQGIFARGVYESPAKKSATATLRSELRTDLRSMQSIVGRGPSSSSHSLESEISALRSAIEELTRDRVEETLGKNDKLAKRLGVAGIEGKAALAIARALKAIGGLDDDALRDAMASTLKATAWPLAFEGKMVIAAVGPSGVGKTTTLAKIAARATLEHDKRIAFVSSDGFRAGAREQVGRFAELLSAELLDAKTPLELRAAIAATTADIVLVDTAGRAPKDGAPERALAALARDSEGTGRKIHTLLCLPASVRAADAESFAKMFAPTAPTALAITKLDETRAPGGIAHAIAASELAVAVLCSGQRVPEDIAPATAGALLDALFAPIAKKARGGKAKKEVAAHG